MTLLAMSSFDLGVVEPEWASPGTLNTTIKRTGVASMYLTSSSSAYRSIAASAEIYAGFAVYFPSSSGYFFQARSNGVNHIQLYRDDTNYVLSARRSTTNVATSTKQLQPKVWYFIEVRCTIDDTAGIIQVWVDGELVINFTGDTRSGGTVTTFDQVGFAPTGPLHIDDLYVLNPLGTVNNTRLGDIDVAALLPTGNGSASAMVGSDGNSVDNYLLVDEQTPDTADYVAATGAGQRDLYVMADAPANAAAVLAVREHWHAATANVGAAGIAPVLKLGASEAVGTSVAASTTATNYAGAIAETDPTGAAWTETTLNSVEVGIEST